MPETQGSRPSPLEGPAAASQRHFRPVSSRGPIDGDWRHVRGEVWPDGLHDGLHEGEPAMSPPLLVRYDSSVRMPPSSRASYRDRPSARSPQFGARTQGRTPRASVQVSFLEICPRRRAAWGAQGFFGTKCLASRALGESACGWLRSQPTSRRMRGLGFARSCHAGPMRPPVPAPRLSIGRRATGSLPPPSCARHGQQAYEVALASSRRSSPAARRASPSPTGARGGGGRPREDSHQA